jgi:hypothetical protein
LIDKSYFLGVGDGLQKNTIPVPNAADAKAAFSDASDSIIRPAHLCGNRDSR